jgi:hypothetical protein
MAKRNGEIFDRIFGELRKHTENLGALLRDVRDIKYELNDINRRLSENDPAFGDVIIETSEGKTIEGTLKHPSTRRTQ